MTDRFHGEAETPPLWEHCGYCGSKICVGDMYYDHNDMHICDGCVKDYAFAELLKTAKRKVADEDWL